MATLIETTEREKMTRTYISEIKSLREWKEDALYLYSDAHKDVYGSRYYPSDLLEDDVPMERVMSAVASIYEQCNAAAEEERKIAIRWEAKMYYHRLMVEEARRSPDAVVYDNPDWDYMCESSSHWAYLDNQIGAELYYFNKSYSNNMVIS